MARLDLPGGRRICSQIHAVYTEDMAISARWMTKTRPGLPGGGRNYGEIYGGANRWMPKI